MKVEIPDEIYRKIEERVKETEFKSVDEYVAYILREVLESLEEEEDQVFSEEEEEKVRERLRALGYID
ncbi:MAG: CopG family transcriptional regulator [Archaeoglobus sp.]|jgi:Arc/MetJ-type ribon-helix-helix transcriptional regulator|nr:MAG: CopG family transcriptional regulator [Archaeoglobus sp.]